MGEQQQNEWIEWSGGECPVDANDRVVVRYRSGMVVPPAWSADAKLGRRAGNWSWAHNGTRHNIIAYRVVSK